MVINMSQVEENLATRNSGSKTTVVASLAALGGVIVASSCCLPLLPFLFAAGAAGTSAFVTALRPYLLALSVLLIVFGFYKSGGPNNAIAGLAGSAPFYCGFQPSWSLYLFSFRR
jgi:cytochrome c biogenesis protein CcdA